MEGLWNRIDVESKNQFKEVLLSTLIEDSPNIRRGTAVCISAIAKIELPLG